MAGLDDVQVRVAPRHADARGYFIECYRADTFYEWTGLRRTAVQVNYSHSEALVLRGLHYQTRHPQGTLVRVLAGEIFDVAVDLRKSSATFGQWKACNLSGENRRQIWIPEGFAHGFLVTSACADVLYQTTDVYDPESERTLLWNDPRVAIVWPLAPGQEPLLSTKDVEGLRLANCPVFP
jgi:dTDP-4-dehydrorhamnose 3,5-epimerase